MKRQTRGSARYRRSPHLVCYWRDGSLIVYNYATGVQAGVNGLICDLLDYCGVWRSAPAIRRFLPGTPEQARRLLDRLVKLSLLQDSGVPIDPREHAMSAFDRWNPAAGFFHSITRDVTFADPREARLVLERQARTWPMPAPVKRYRNAPVVELPRARQEGPLADTLLARRTWRRFSATPVTLAEMSTLLALTVGVQQWVTVGRQDLPLKTFPSGGARHPIECYVVAPKLEGLAPGIYHYSSDRHRLERVRRGATARDIRRYLPRSGHFAGASALVLFTAIFERQIWRYPYARAYRAALVEAGHACQTFCLAATSLKLAPFSVMGLADSAIEKDLGVDGVSESVLYAAGVGRPPARTAWAPLAHGSLTARPNPAFRRG